MIMLLYIFFTIILILLVVSVEPFTPAARHGHSTSLVDTKLYFIGGIGRGNNDSISTQTFYLDVSGTFSLSNIPWNAVTSSVPVGVSFTQTFVGGKSRNQIYLYGGLRKDPVNFTVIQENEIYSFNTKTLLWNKLEVRGNIPLQRRRMQIPVDDSGKAYVFGGQNETVIFKDMNLFDTTLLDWTSDISSSDFTTPPPRTEYTATLLKSGFIVYIGGIEVVKGNNDYVDMQRLSIFDTKSSQWGITGAKGEQIGGRRAHQAVLTQDERIIIYGGLTGDPNGPAVPATPSLAILETKDGIFRWSFQQPSGNSPPSLSYFTSTIIGDYMLIAFGNTTNPTATSSNLYILDVATFAWVDAFEPSKNFPIITIIVGSVSGLIFLVIIITAVVCYRRKKGISVKERKVDDIPNSNQNYNPSIERERELEDNNNNVVRGQIPPMARTAQPGFGQQYYQGGLGRYVDGDGVINYPYPPSPTFSSPPIHQPIQPQIIQNNASSGIIPQHGYISQQGHISQPDRFSPSPPPSSYYNQSSYPNQPQLNYFPDVNKPNRNFLTPDDSNMRNVSPRSNTTSTNVSHRSNTPMVNPYVTRTVAIDNFPGTAPGSPTINRPESLIERIRKIGNGRRLMRRNTNTSTSNASINSNTTNTTNTTTTVNTNRRGGNRSGNARGSNTRSGMGINSGFTHNIDNGNHGYRGRNYYNN